MPCLLRSSIQSSITLWFTTPTIFSRPMAMTAALLTMLPLKLVSTLSAPEMAAATLPWSLSPLSARLYTAPCGALRAAK